jgi:hypothetical protein
MRFVNCAFLRERLGLMIEEGEKLAREVSHLMSMPFLRA